MSFPTATQTEVFVLATQLHEELKQVLQNSPSAYKQGFEDAFRKARKNPNQDSKLYEEDQEEYNKGFMFGTALRAIVRRKHLGVDDPEAE